MIEKRSSWSTRAMTCELRGPGTYLGAAVHWPGDPGLTLAGKDHSECLRTLRNIENYQMDVHVPPYGGLAYQIVACLHGKVIEGRTAKRKNGANGIGIIPNTQYGSILALVGISDDVTDELKSAVLAAREPLGVRKLYTHNEVRPEPTACPGPDLTKWIKAGYPAPEEDVAAKDIWDYALDNFVQGGKSKAGALVSRTHQRTAELTVELASVKATVDLIASTTNLTAQEIEDAAQAGAKAALENLKITAEVI